MKHPHRLFAMPGPEGHAVWGGRWAAPLALVVLLALLVGACSSPSPRKRSFMASAAGVRQEADTPVGLNPLGSLDTCRPDREAFTAEGTAGARVLISRPEHFTRSASLMISSLREALTRPEAGLPPVELLLAPQRIVDARQAHTLGQACGALIVLWEPWQTKTLELSLPQPAQVPLRPLVQERLCEFGSHAEQLNILYLTIAGLLTLRDNDYDRAVLFMESARAIDNRCLQLPGAKPPRDTAPPGASQ